VRVAVCVKQVPATTRVVVDPETRTLVREGVQSTLNPLDAFAVEEALRVRERLGGTVTAITLGPRQAEAMLRQVLALGVEEGVLVTGREFAGSDTWATSYALARAIETLGGFDLILCGKQAVDGDTGHVGPELAAQLGLPQLTYVRRVREVSRRHLVVECIADYGYQVLRTPLPAVMTVVKELNEPRGPNLADLRRARFAPLRVLGLEEIGGEAAQVGLEGSPTRVEDIFAPSAAREGRLYERDIEAGCRHVLRVLEGEGLL